MVEFDKKITLEVVEKPKENPVEKPVHVAEPEIFVFEPDPNTIHNDISNASRSKNIMPMFFT